MASTTKDAILQTAKRLFGERGYNAVSTADIADAVGISKGNLTYHFKKKEDIVAALLSENPPHATWPTPGTLAELDATFSHIESVVRENAFYFWHYTQLAQISPDIRSLQLTAVSGNRDFLMRALESLDKGGLLVVESADRGPLVNSILLTCAYWLPFAAIEDLDATAFRSQVWSLLVPYLTKEGRAQYASLGLGA